MKTVKPLVLSPMHRAIEHGGRSHLAVTGAVFIALDDPSVPLLEMDLWKVVPKELGEGAALDEAMPKSRGEVLVTGSAYAPNGAPAVTCDVSVTVGPLRKTLRVIGDRAWNADGTASPPAPFTEMPLTWERSAGGEGYPSNPLGRGYAVVQGERGPSRPLPNVEDPRLPTRHPDDRHPPAGFGAYDFMWPQRHSKLGTYDERWLREDFPGFARDIDWTAFNVAPVDQWVEGYFRGDEVFALENLHPAHPRIEGRLPGLVVRAFVNRRGSDGVERFDEVPTRLDTVHFFPRVMRAVLLYRGVVGVDEDDASDVLQLLLGCERAGAPKPVEHYRTVLAQRLDPKTGALHSLRDRDLTPAGMRSGFATLDDEGPPKSPGVLRANLRRKAELQLEATRAMLVARGIDPDKHLPRELPEAEVPVAPDDIPEAIERAEREAARAEQDAEAERARAEEKARALCARKGVDYDAAVAKAKAERGGPPKLSIDEQLRATRVKLAGLRERGFDVSAAEAQLSDPAMLGRLAQAQVAALEAYKAAAHHRDAAGPMAVELGRRVRAVLREGVSVGHSFEGWDLTGADLSEMHLAGAQLRGALMEGVSLRGSNLAGADLTGAVLARADLTGAVLSGAKLGGANLGGATLRGARAIEPVDLRGATLWRTDLTDSALRGAELGDAMLFEVKLPGAELSGLKARKANFMQCELAGAALAGGELQGALFMECDLRGADLSGAKLKGATFYKARGEGAKLRGADAENLRVVCESSFEGADLQEMRMPKATLRGAKLAGAKLSKSELDGSDFSECDLRGAQLYKSSARDALFVRADLTGAVMISAGLLGAVLQKATLEGADLTDAVLFGADMARTRGRPKSLEGANLGRVRVIGGASGG